MIIRLDRIGDESFAWRESLSVAAEELERQELVGLGEVACHGRVTALSAGFLLEARLFYEQTLACVRCLAPIAEPVESKVELVVSRPASEPPPGELELSESDLDSLFVDDKVLDTRPILLEQLQLNIPMRALCREDCAGLCPECGVNRNDSACDCGDRAVDPRWKALRAWSSKT